ncbi:MAG: hypothetical protein JXB50_14640 [Spirochaetes bacterium]|nr:hypothetical protein [Spirochaetota bacterium]
MSLSKKEIEKIYQIKDRLLLTYKAASTDKQKKRIKSYLSKVELIIEDIERGVNIDPSELNIFSSALKNEEEDIIEENDEFSYNVKIDKLKISEHNKDSEMDQIFSFFVYFENNFYTSLGIKYLKLDYNFNKKRDLFFAHFDSFKILLNQYIDDLGLLHELRFSNQIDQYKSRFEQQKKYLLVKLSELLHELRDFTRSLLNDLKHGKNGFINPDEVFENKLSFEKNEFEGMIMQDIIKEVNDFVEEFIEIIRMPDFRKNL